MEAKENAAEKRIVDQLTFGEKTAKRAKFEAFEFTVVGPHLIEVCNASYGSEKDNHTYLVGVEVRDGLTLPAECECPADMYTEEYACKHRVSLATVGGPTVLQAAVEFESPAPASSDGDRVATDGGDVEQQEGPAECGECEPEFPCADCFISGKRELPE